MFKRLFFKWSDASLRCVACRGCVLLTFFEMPSTCNLFEGRLGALEVAADVSSLFFLLLSCISSSKKIFLFCIAQHYATQSIHFKRCQARSQRHAVATQHGKRRIIEGCSTNSQEEKKGEHFLIPNAHPSPLNNWFSEKAGGTEKEKKRPL